jgi:hypothetical protein
MRVVVMIIVVMSLVAAACGGSSDDPPSSGTEPSAEASPDPTATPEDSSGVAADDEADGGDGVASATPTAIPTPTPTDPVVLAAYLADLNVIDAVLVFEQTVIGQFGDPALLAAANLGAADRLDALVPPAEAEVLHDGWTSFLREQASALTDLAWALRSGGQREVDAAANAVVALAVDSADDLAAIVADQFQLESQALAGIDSPEADYLAALRENAAESDVVVGELFSALGLLAADLPAAIDAIDALLADLDRVVAGLEDVQPPPSLEDLHRSRIDTISTLATVWESFVDAVYETFGVPFDGLRQLEALATRAQFDAATLGFVVAAVLGGPDHDPTSLVEGHPAWSAVQRTITCTIGAPVDADQSVLTTYCRNNAAVRIWSTGIPEGWTLFAYEPVVGWTEVATSAVDDLSPALDALLPTDGFTDVDGLCVLTARSLGRSPDDVCEAVELSDEERTVADIVVAELDLPADSVTSREARCLSRTSTASRHLLQAIQADREPATSVQLAIFDALLGCAPVAIAELFAAGSDAVGDQLECLTVGLVRNVDVLRGALTANANDRPPDAAVAIGIRGLADACGLTG